MNTNAKTYTINLKATVNDAYDWDEFVCMNQQLFAISQGWADPIKIFVNYDVAPIVYTWEAST